MRPPLRVPLEKHANASQQSWDVVRHNVLQELRIHLIVGVDQDVSGIDPASPGDLRMFDPELFTELVGRLANDLKVTANRICGHFVLHPMVLAGDGLLKNPLGSISDVKEIEDRVFHSFALKRHRFGKDAVADIRVKAGGFHQINGRGQQVAKVRLQPSEIEQIAAGVEVDEEVDIAAGATLPAGHRSENSHVRRAMKPSQRQNGGPLFELERFERHHLLVCMIALSWGQLFTAQGFFDRLRGCFSARLADTVIKAIQTGRLLIRQLEIDQSHDPFRVVTESRYAWDL